MMRNGRSVCLGNRFVWLGAAVALLGLVVSCGDDGGGGTTATPPLAGQEAAEASTGVAFSTFAMVGGVFDAIPDLDNLGGSKAVGRTQYSAIKVALKAAAIAKNRADAATRVPVPCEGGGTRDLSCTVDETGSHFTGVFVDCVIDTSQGASTTINGSVTLDTADPLACFSDSIPDSVAVTIAFNDFSIVVKDTGGVIVETFNADLTLAVAPSGPGCDGYDGTISIDGTLDAISIFDDLNLTLIADNLVITTTSVQGKPCTTTAVVTGGVFISDGETSFSEVVDLTLTHRDFGTYDCVTIDGTVSTNCTVGLTFETISPVYTNDGADCPYAGVVDVTLSDDTVARITFTDTGGVTFDYPVDGTPDVSFDTCDDPEIEDCNTTS